MGAASGIAGYGAFASVLKPPKIEPHAFCAAWNAGEFRSIPAPPKVMPNPPSGPAMNFGSGKLGTPCERMQRAMASACALIFAVCDFTSIPMAVNCDQQLVFLLDNTGDVFV